jgi:uncharacterized protein involved in outer membrane biogenesis
MSRKWMMTLAVIFLVLAGLHLSLFFGIWSVPLKRWTSILLQRHFQNPIEMGRVRLNLIPTILILSDFKIGHPTAADPLLYTKEVRVTLSPWSLMTELTVIQNIKFKEPSINLTLLDQDPGGVFGLLFSARDETVTEKTSQDKLGIVIREAVIQEGSLKILRQKDQIQAELNGISGKILPDIRMENFQFVLTGRDATLIQRDRMEQFDRWEIKAVARQDSIKIRKAEIFGSDKHLTLSGNLQNGPDPRFALSLDATFPLARLQAYVDLKHKLEGRARLLGELTGRRLSASFNGHAEIHELSVDHVAVGHATTALSYKDHRLRLFDFSASIFNGQARGEGTFEFSSLPASYQLSLNFTSLSPGPLAAFLGQSKLFPAHTLDGQIAISGQGLNRDSLSGKGNLKLTLRSDLVPSGSLHDDWNSLANSVQTTVIDFELQQGMLSLNDAQAETTRSQITLQGRIGLQDELDLDFKLTSKEVHEFTPLLNMGFLQGFMDLKGSLRGTLKEPVVEADGMMQRAKIRNRPFEQITGHLYYQHPKLSFTSTRFIENRSTYVLDGFVSFDPLLPYRLFFDLQADISEGSPRDTVAIFYKELPITHAASGHLKARGQPNDFQLHADLTVGSGEIYGQRLDAGRLKLTVTHQQVSFEDVQVQYGDNTVSGEGWIRYDGNFKMAVSSPGTELTDVVWIQNYLNDITAVVSGRLNGEGLLKQPEFEAEAQILNSTYRNQPFGPGVMSGSFVEEKLALKIKLDNGLSVEGFLVLKEPLPFHVDVGLKQFQATPFLAMLDFPYREGLTVEGSGEITVEGELRSLPEIKSSVRLNQFTTDAGGYSLSNTKEVLINVTGPVVDVESFQLEGKGSRLSVSGSLEIFKDYNILVKGEADLDFLRAFSKEIVYSHGKAQLALQILDQWRDPEIRGNLSLENGTITSETLKQTVMIRSMALSFDKHQMILQSLEGELGGGDLIASGKWDLSGLSFIRSGSINLELSGTRITAVPDLIGTMDASLLFYGDGQNMYLNGEIIIDRASYNRRLDWQKWVMDVLKRERPEPEAAPPLENVLLNIHVIGEKNIRINNNLAKIPLEIDLFIKGTVKRPVVLGRIEASEGTIFFRRNDFRILSGMLDFIDPERIKPILEIKATTRVRTRQTLYLINLNLVGPVDRLDLTLTSDPPLENHEILALLTFGKTPDEIAESSTEIGAGEAADLLTGEIQDVVEEQFKAITGVDRIQVDPYFSKTRAGGTPRVTVSKRLYEDRLYVTYQTTFDPAEEDVIQIEYIINNNISLVGGRDEQGEAGGDLKFRFEFR